jgi:hypothetical protein
MDHNDTKQGDALPDADLWAQTVIAEAEDRLDPPDEAGFLTEVIDVLSERRDETFAFIHGDDAQPNQAGVGAGVSEGLCADDSVARETSKR